MGSIRTYFSTGVLCACVLGLAAASSAGQTMFHGIQIGKSCEPDRCPGEATDCRIAVSYNDDFGDTVTITDAWDVIDPQGAAVRIPPVGNLPITAVSGNTTCTVGGSLPCLICDGNSPCGGPMPISAMDGMVIFRQNQYVIRPGDPNPLPNQANVRIRDVCDGCGDTPPCPGCSTNPNLVQFTAASELKVCEDDDPCTQNVCVGSGQCAFPPICETNEDCDDSNRCTLDVCTVEGCCDNTGECVRDSDCYDGSTCTLDKCIDGCCENPQIICPPDPNPCNTRLCNPFTGFCDLTKVGCDDDNPCTEDRCTAGGCVNERIACCALDCPPITKAKFDIWNENERRFSGTERCIPSWDQTLLSTYPTPRNHFLRMFLQTNYGKARIDGLSSTVCGTVGGTNSTVDTPLSNIDAPLLGVAARNLVFTTGPRAWSASELVGMGVQVGEIRYDLGGPAPPSAREGEFRGTLDDKASSREPIGTSVVAGFPPENDGVPGRSGVSQKGSLLAFVKLEIKWNAAGALITDTFVELTNDYFERVRVQLYLVHGDECKWVDHALTLTPDQPTYWSALTGQPAGMTPFTVFGEPCPDDDPFNPGGTRLRGYLLAWAIDETTGAEINWNHLSGSATIVNYSISDAWEYAPWAFQARVDVPTGDPLLAPYGVLSLDDNEYQAAPAQLLMEFFASGASFINGGVSFGIDTDLTLWAAIKDLRQDAGINP